MIGEGDAQVVVERGILRVELDGLSEAFNGFLQLSLIVKGNAQVTLLPPGDGSMLADLLAAQEGATDER